MRGGTSANPHCSNSCGAKVGSAKTSDIAAFPAFAAPHIVRLGGERPEGDAAWRLRQVSEKGHSRALRRSSCPGNRWAESRSSLQQRPCSRLGFQSGHLRDAVMSIKNVLNSCSAREDTWRDRLPWLGVLAGRDDHFCPTSRNGGIALSDIRPCSK